MFEKQSNNVSQIINQSFSPSLTPGGQRPISSAGANLAAANVAAASQMMPPAAPSGRNLEDIFSQTDSSALRPSAPTDSNFQPGMAPVYADSGYSGHNEQFFGGRRLNIAGVVAIVVAVLVLGVLIVMGWLLFTSKSSADMLIGGGAIDNGKTNVDNSAKNIQQSVDVEITSSSVKQSGQNSSGVVKEQDSDGDGLSDVEEKKYSTDPYSVDTDKDGLTDRAEVKIYHTDPLNPDTDGDGHKDGEEVINGFDPRKGGSAKLFEAPKK